MYGLGDLCGGHAQSSQRGDHLDPAGIGAVRYDRGC
jgi:hypothetical protein